MGSDKKRKRDANTDTELKLRPSKAQITENGINKAAQPDGNKKSGEARQLKSERRKKQDRSAKQNSKPTKVVATAGSVSEQTLAQDDLASGQDFVSLSAESITAKVSKKDDTQKGKKGTKQPNGDMNTNPTKGNSPTNERSSVRFICFVGNLPYTATTEQVTAHFAKLQPKAVRLSTDKKTKKPKGFAFVEFDDYDRMKTCLKLYHHSIFDPENIDADKKDGHLDQTSKLKGRKINVELTAGGGGAKSIGRRDRIKAKNEKLDEERTRDWEKKKLEEIEKEKSHDARRGRGKKLQLSGANADAAGDLMDDTRGVIHPSRMSRVKA